VRRWAGRGGHIYSRVPRRWASANRVAGRKSAGIGPAARRFWCVHIQVQVQSCRSYVRAPDRDTAAAGDAGGAVRMCATSAAVALLVSGFPSFLGAAAGAGSLALPI